MAFAPNIRKRAPNAIVLAPVIMKKTPNKVGTEYNKESNDYNKNSTEYNETRRLKAIPWDALTRERCIGMNCEVTVMCND